MPRVQTANPAPPKEVRLVRASVNAVGVVEHFADLYAAIDQFVAAGLDVGDNQVQSLGGAGCGPGDVVAEDDRTSGTGRRELDHAEVAIVGGVVGVEPPPQAAVEGPGAVDVRNRDDHDLKLEVDIRVLLRLHSGFPILSKYLSRSDRGPKATRDRRY